MHKNKKNWSSRYRFCYCCRFDHSLKEADVQLVPCNTLSQEQFFEVYFSSRSNTPLCLNKYILQLTRMALKGCDTAEMLAHTHRNRPCFKKIDSLCARLKQDLQRSDSVLANINSQGVAWAVKDFIFVFTRIINAWIIIKGYVYNTPEGLAKVKSSLSGDFTEQFLKWQDSTISFVDSIIKSFINLDEMVQSQRTSFQKTESNKNCKNASKNDSHTAADPIADEYIVEYLTKLFNHDNEPKKSDDKLSATTNNIENSVQAPTINNNLTIMATGFFPKIIEESEESQIQAAEKGTYFKTGKYNPMKKDKNINNNNNNNNSMQKNENNNNNSMESLVECKSMFTNNTSSLASSDTISPINMMDMSNGMGINYDPNHVEQTPRAPFLKDLNSLSLNNIMAAKSVEYHIRNIDDDFEEAKNLTAKVEYLLNKMMNLEESQYLFKTVFTKNYVNIFFFLFIYDLFHIIT